MTGQSTNEFHVKFNEPILGEDGLTVTEVIKRYRRLVESIEITRDRWIEQSDRAATQSSLASSTSLERAWNSRERLCKTHAGMLDAILKVTKEGPIDDDAK